MIVSSPHAWPRWVRVRVVVTTAAFFAVALLSIGTAIVQRSPPVTLAIAAGFVAMAASGFFAWVPELRATNVEWTLAEEGLVRRVGGQARTIPWARVRGVTALRRNTRTREGHVQVWFGRFGTPTRFYVPTPEGKVRLFRSFLFIVDAPDAEVVAAEIRDRAARAKSSA